MLLAVPYGEVCFLFDENENNLFLDELNEIFTAIKIVTQKDLI